MCASLYMCERVFILTLTRLHLIDARSQTNEVSRQCSAISGIATKRSYASCKEVSFGIVKEACTTDGINVVLEV